MTELDRTQQRIVGVLIEKELTVPDAYPLTENALIAGCNQKSNRDPEMGLEQFEVHGAIVALMAEDWVKTTTSTGGHATRYAHRLDSQYAVDEKEKAVLCELLIRGPQAPGALKPRVARLGFNATPTDIESVLRGMAERPAPMVEQLPRRPRERDHRWRHRLGPIDPSHAADAAPSAAPSAARPTAPSAAAPAAAPITAPQSDTRTPADSELLRRVERLEADLAALHEEVRRLQDASATD